MRQVIGLLNEVAGIMYVGGILSHIVLGATVGSPDPQTTYTVYTYKELSAYILILPGLGLKVLCDLILYFGYGVRQNWMKIKLVLIAFLTINAFVFLVPMMPELRAMALAAIPSGHLPEAFHSLEGKEALIGMSNALPLLGEILLGNLKPRLWDKRQSA